MYIYIYIIISESVGPLTLCQVIQIGEELRYKTFGWRDY